MEENPTMRNEVRVITTPKTNRKLKTELFYNRKETGIGRCLEEHQVNLLGRLNDVMSARGLSSTLSRISLVIYTNSFTRQTEHKA